MVGDRQVREWLTGVPVQHCPRGQALPDRAWVVWRVDSEKRNRRHDIRSSQSPNMLWSPPPAEERKEKQQRINKWRVCMRDSINTHIINDKSYVSLNTNERDVFLHTEDQSKSCTNILTQKPCYMMYMMMCFCLASSRERKMYLLYFQK